MIGVIASESIIQYNRKSFGVEASVWSDKSKFRNLKVL